MSEPFHWVALSRGALAIGLLSLVFTLVSPAANAKHAPASVDTQARASYARGKKLLAKSRYADALEEFNRGYKMSGRPLFLFNIAECLRFQGNLTGARSFYKQYLNEAPTGKMAKNAEARLAALPELPTPPKPPAPDLSLDPDRLRDAVEAKPVVVLQAPPPAPPRKKTWPIWVGVTVGLVVAAAIVTGAVLGTQHESTGYSVDLR